MNVKAVTGERFAESRVQADVTRAGFSRFDSSDLRFSRGEQAAFVALQRVASNMPRDAYARGVQRSRLYGKAYLHPDLPLEGGLFFQRPRLYRDGRFGISFEQAARYNPEEGGVRRVFEPIPEMLFANAAIRRLIDFTFACTTFDEDERAGMIQVGLHIVRLEAGETEPATASPDCIHTDGEPYTCAILLDRVNARGGENYVTDLIHQHKRPHEVPEQGIRACFTLEKPLESYIVMDTRVAHYVAPVRRADASVAGYRTVMLIDFTPMSPALV